MSGPQESWVTMGGRVGCPGSEEHSFRGRLGGNCVGVGWG